MLLPLYILELPIATRPRRATHSPQGTSGKGQSQDRKAELIEICGKEVPTSVGRGHVTKHSFKYSIVKSPQEG